MAFVPEDGTGLSNANSLCAVAAADTYWGDRGNTAWSALSTAAKQAALVLASDYVRNQTRYQWYGSKKSYLQTMPWPRTGAVERYGQSVPDNVVPWQVIEAVSYLALRASSAELQPDLAHGGQVASETVGPISVSYFEGAARETIIQIVDGLLRPLLRSDPMPLSPSAHIPDIPEGFVTGEFESA